MKKRFLFLVAFIFAAAAGANAQTYQTAFGAKFYAGNETIGGINIRHSTSENTALEGSLLFFNGGGVGLEGLYELQGAINGAPGLQYVVGGGAMLGVSNDKFSFALRLTGGIDYKFPDVPIDVSLGFDPFFYLAPETHSYLPLGIGLRYVIK